MEVLEVLRNLVYEKRFSEIIRLYKYNPEPFYKRIIKDYLKTHTSSIKHTKRLSLHRYFYLHSSTDEFFYKGIPIRYVRSILNWFLLSGRFGNPQRHLYSDQVGYGFGSLIKTDQGLPYYEYGFLKGDGSFNGYGIDPPCPTYRKKNLYKNRDSYVFNKKIKRT